MFCVARGLSLCNGAAIAGDATMASPLHASGAPWPRAADSDGVALARARGQHEDHYPELVDGERARLVVLGCEVGGRWAPEVGRMLASLVELKCKEAPSLLR